MENEISADKKIFKSLTRYYVLALLAVAMISIIGQFLIQLILKELIDDSHVVNIAGRQRMYSQKITKNALIIFESSKKGVNNLPRKQKLKTDLQNWSTSHDDLKFGKLFTNKLFNNNHKDKIATLYDSLDPHFIAIKQNAEILLNTQPIEYQQIAINNILQHEGEFLTIMNKIVEQYDLEAKAKVTKTRLFELLLFSLLLIVLLFEALFIFRPIANQIKNSFQKITNTSEQLTETNKILLATNSNLQKTKFELEKTNQEKYALKEAEEKIRTMTLLSGQDQERKRLSRELHDGIGQMLTGIRLQVEHLQNQNPEKPTYKESFQELKQLIGETIEATRSVAYNLAPSVLTDFGLLPALHLFIEQCNHAGTFKITLKNDQEFRLPENIEIALYRIVQEAVNNALKYSNAKELQIIIIKTEAKITLNIIDNGIGFDLNKYKKNQKSLEKNGLKNMKTRAEILSGTFQITSKIGNGTKIQVLIPI